MEARPARPEDLGTAAAWLGLEEAPRGASAELALGASLALEEGGAPIALALLRPWGRVLVVPLLVVDPARRGRGHGRRLVAALREEALRRDARTLGLEAEVSDTSSLAALLRCGFKAGPPAVELDWPLPEPPEEEAEPATAPLPEEVAALASSLDAAFEPADWLEGRRAGGARLVGARDESGRLAACALVDGGRDEDSRSCPLVLLGDSEPFESLAALGRALAAGGARSASVAVPARQADALRALLRAGGRPVGLRLRLCLEGFPERADLRRAVLASWR